MKRMSCVLPLLLAGGLAQAAQPERPGADCHAVEATTFTGLPMLLASGRGDRQGVPYCLANLRADAVEARNGAGGFIPPAQVPVQAAGFRLSAGKVGNYHWLQAREVTREAIVTASTAHYFANPGPAPTQMLHVVKAELEIVPQPLPREHWQYRAGETWEFLLRFHGQPLPSTGVRLETSGGTQVVLRSDDRGVVRVTFPSDVTDQPARDGHDHGRGGQNRFVLAAGLTDRDGRYYLTAFNHVYGAAADAGRSLPAGLGFLALGGLLAVPLVIRRKENGHG